MLKRGDGPDLGAGPLGAPPLHLDPLNLFLFAPRLTGRRR